MFLAKTDNFLFSLLAFKISPYMLSKYTCRYCHDNILGGGGGGDLNIF